MQANAPAHVIDAAISNSERSSLQECEVWEDNWASLMLFLKVQTQWIISPMGGYVGLNYDCVISVMRILGIKKKDRCELFNYLQIIEYTILKVKSEQNERAR